MIETTAYSLPKRQVWNKHQEMIKSSATPVYCSMVYLVRYTRDIPVNSITQRP